MRWRLKKIPRRRIKTNTAEGRSAAIKGRFVVFSMKFKFLWKWKKNYSSDSSFHTEFANRATLNWMESTEWNDQFWHYQKLVKLLAGEVMKKVWLWVLRGWVERDTKMEIIRDLAWKLRPSPTFRILFQFQRHFSLRDEQHWEWHYINDNFTEPTVNLN